MLWELVHVFFEHRGCCVPQQRGHDAGASSFLYPFLAEHEHDLEAVLGDVRESVLMKAEEVQQLRERTVLDAADPLAAAARSLRECFARGGTLLALGNGGSATDAMDLVADLRRRRACRDRPDCRQRDHHRDRQRHRPRGDLRPPGDRIRARRDVLVALSTSGNSLSMIEALLEARRRELRTIAFVGYDGGRIAAEGLADHVVITPSQHIPRIQEAQATAYHLLCEKLVERGRMTSLALSTACAIRARVHGTVQGVGFRPFVYRLAREQGSPATSSTTSAAFCSRSRASRSAVERFLPRLEREAPPLAVIERVIREPMLGRRRRRFTDRRERAGAASPTRP